MVAVVMKQSKCENIFKCRSTLQRCMLPIISVKMWTCQIHGVNIQ